jgi:hypothetical protein
MDIIIVSTTIGSVLAFASGYYLGSWTVERRKAAEWEKFYDSVDADDDYETDPVYLGSEPPVAPRDYDYNKPGPVTLEPPRIEPLPVRPMAQTIEGLYAPTHELSQVDMRDLPCGPPPAELLPTADGVQLTKPAGFDPNPHTIPDLMEMEAKERKQDSKAFGTITFKDANCPGQFNTLSAMEREALRQMEDMAADDRCNALYPLTRKEPPP